MHINDSTSIKLNNIQHKKEPDTEVKSQLLQVENIETSPVGASVLRAYVGVCDKNSENERIIPQEEITTSKKNCSNLKIILKNI